MIYLILGVVANVLLFLAFRSYTVFKIDNLQAIVVNYIVCVLTGIIFMGDWSILRTVDLTASWSWFAVFIGMLLILGFYVAALTAQRSGVSITSVASKMSMVLPILFSLFILKIDTFEFTVFNYLGMSLAVLSVYLGSVRQRDHSAKKQSRFFWLLPFAVFLLGGLIDISINYSNHVLIDSENEDVFPILLFACAAAIGVVALLMQKKPVRLKNVIGGIYLGIPNYFALYLVFKALSDFQNNGAVFYPLFNVCIILLSSISAMIFFREKLSMLNLFGLALAVISLFLLSYQEILAYFRFT